MLAFKPTVICRIAANGELADRCYRIFFGEKALAIHGGRDESPALLGTLFFRPAFKPAAAFVMCSRHTIYLPVERRKVTPVDIETYTSIVEYLSGIPYVEASLGGGNRKPPSVL